MSLRVGWWRRLSVSFGSTGTATRRSMGAPILFLHDNGTPERLNTVQDTAARDLQSRENQATSS